MENNDNLLHVEVQNHQPILVRQFDTPLQIAHRFCTDNRLEMKHCKRISQTVIRILKTFATDLSSLHCFQKYFHAANCLPSKKKVFTLQEILNPDDHQPDKENQRENGEHDPNPQTSNDYYSFQNDMKIEVYTSPKNLELPTKVVRGKNFSMMESKKLEDLSKKLYQNILSPSPDCQPTAPQTTKHVSILQKQLQPHKQQSQLNKSLEKLHRSTTYHSNTNNKSGIVKATTVTTLDSTEKKKKSHSILGSHNVRQLIQRKTTMPNNRSMSGGKIRCKTEQDLDKLQRKCYQLFQLMDSDKDGCISPANIDLSQLNDETLNSIISVLLEIDNKQLSLNAYQFYQMLEGHFQRMDAQQRARFLA